MSILLHREIDYLKRQILSEVALVEQSVERAMQAVTQRDESIAERVIQGDYEINRREVEIEEDCLKILALHQPVAKDLRYVVSVLKINNDLERIGDLAVNISERALNLARFPEQKMTGKLFYMSEDVRDMLRKSIQSLVESDVHLAKQVIVSDDKVDDSNRQVFKEVQEELRKDPGKVEILIMLTSVSRQLERIADLATNIAEDVIYLVSGEIVRHNQEKIPRHSRQNNSGG